MAERKPIRHSELLTSEETVLLEDGGIERAARAVVSEAVARLVGALGLTGSTGHEIVGVFRELSLGTQDEVLGSAVDVSEKVNQLTATISRRGAAVLRVVERDDTLTAINLASSASDDVAPTAKEETSPLKEEVVVLPVVASHAEAAPVIDIATEVQDDDQERPIELNIRSLRYIQAIFGDVSSLDLREKHKSAIAHTIAQLRGVPRSNHQLVDIAPQLLLMFAGLKDKEIGAQEHIQKTGTAVSVNASSVVKRVKDRPDYSAERARAVLAQNLGLANIQPVLHDEEVTEGEEEVVDDEVASEQATVVETTAIQLNDTPALGKLRGEVRRILKKNGQNHLINLDGPYLGRLVEEMFIDEDTYKDHYVTFLQRGVRESYDTNFTRVINSMPQKIATHLAQKAAAHHRPVAVQSDSQPEMITPVTPLMMPRQRPHLVPIIMETAVEEETLPQEIEASPLMLAALEPETMPDEEWFVEARRALKDACQVMGWSDTEAALLWNMVHFDKKHLYKRPIPATEAVRHKLFALMEEGDDRLNVSRDIKASLTMLLNTTFGVKDLDDIQKSLKRKNPNIAEGAAQRYVVAGIHELMREV